MTELTRRERSRRDTTDEIKQAAWAEVQETGPSALSLRSVARRVNLTPSAIYRYFDSRDALLTALIIDAYSAVAEELESRYRRSRGSARTVFLKVALAYRRWALDHRVEYELIFGTSIPGYTGTEQTTLAAMRSTNVLLQILADLLAEGGFDHETWQSRLTPELRGRLQGWADEMAEPLPPEALLAALSCYANLHGAINVQMHSLLPPMLDRNEDLFVATINRSLDDLQLAPAHHSRSMSPG